MHLAYLRGLTIRRLRNRVRTLGKTMQDGFNGEKLSVLDRGYDLDKGGQLIERTLHEI